MENENVKLSPLELMEILRDKVAGEGLSPAKMAVSVGDLRDLLDRVTVEETGQAKTQTLIAGILQKQADTNPDGIGLPMPHIWRSLLQSGSRVTNIEVENAITALLDAEVIESVREGLTHYRLTTAFKEE